MAKYTTKLIDKKEVAEGTMAFHFQKPQDFEFKAGQSLDLTLISPPETDMEGNMRAFSITSAPQDSDIVITTRMRDTAFKRVLKAMPFGTDIQIEGPFGSFTLHNDVAKAAVFLSGGIGITPFSSMVHDAATRGLPHQIYLFYSNRRPEDAAYLEELQSLEKMNPNYHFVGTMTDMSKSSRAWAGEQGYITAEMLRKHVPDMQTAIYYLAGPAAMVGAMRKMLETTGVDSDNIRTEEFSGY